MPAWATSECLYNSRKNPRASPKTFGMTRMTPGIESCLNSKGMVGCSRTSSEGLSEGIAHCADVPDSIIVPGLFLVYGQLDRQPHRRTVCCRFSVDRDRRPAVCGRQRRAAGRQPGLKGRPDGDAE